MSEPILLDTGTQSSGDSLDAPAPYYAKAHPVATRPGCWNVHRIEVIERASERVLGEYTYNYSSPHRTFHPFFLRGRWYALYSRNYTASRLMSLPDCTDLGGEDPGACGFCPVDFFVPGLHYIESIHDAACPRHVENGADHTKSCTCPGIIHRAECPRNTPDSNQSCICKAEWDEHFDKYHVWHYPDRIYGFVAGCIWGDDSSWKIEFLDLSRADEGILKREQRFGYIEMPRNLTLSQAIHVDTDDGNAPCLRIDTCRIFDILSGKADEA